MIFKNQKILTGLIVLVSFFIVIHSNFTISYEVGPNYKNVTVDSRVNITNAPPEVLSVTIYEGIDPADSLTLLAGQTRTVYCNATVRDWNGYADINTTNATFWDDNSVNMADSDNRNNHYTNASCTNVGNDGQYLSYWQCAFEVYYHANNGSNWVCNVTVIDNSSFSRSNHNTTTINSLYALNLSSTDIDYGDVAVEDYSENKTATVYNYGNMPINVSVWGYGSTFDDGLAFVCNINGNVSIDNERFSINSAHDWAAKTALSSSPQNVGLTIGKQTENGVMMSNETYWQVYIPVTNNPAGECSGNVVFSATVP